MNIMQTFKIILVTVPNLKAKSYLLLIQYYLSKKVYGYEDTCQHSNIIQFRMTLAINGSDKVRRKTSERYLLLKIANIYGGANNLDTEQSLLYITYIFYLIAKA